MAQQSLNAMEARLFILRLMPICGVTSYMYIRRYMYIYELISYSGGRLYQYNEVQLCFERLQAFLELQVFK